MRYFEGVRTLFDRNINKEVSPYKIKISVQ